MAALGIKIGLFFFGLVVLHVWLAWMENTLTPTQMLQHYPKSLQNLYPYCFPLIANGGVWGDGILLPPLAAYVIGKCGDQWSINDVFVAFALGLLGSILAHKYVYLQGKYPDALAGPNGLSLAGAVHIIYFAGYLAFVLLFVMSRAPQETIVITGIVLALHMGVANHLPLKYLREVYHFVWCPDIFKEEANPLRIFGITTTAIAIVASVKYLFPGSLLALIR